MFATREQMLTAGKTSRRYTSVRLPSCGMELRLQSLNEREMSRYRLFSLDQSGTFDKALARQASSLLIILCAVDENGAALFTERDVEAIEEMDAADVTAAFNACRSHCGLLTDGVSAALGNSKPAQD